VYIDDRDIRGGQKPWDAIKKGYPLRLEIGPRDMEQSQVVVSRRDGPVGNKVTMPLTQLASTVPQLLSEIQTNYFKQGQELLQSSIRTDVKNYAELEALFRSSDEEGARRPISWVRAKWCEDPATLELLGKLKLTIRCFPTDSDNSPGRCI